jgi:AcrR family transcriptional regulator
MARDHNRAETRQRVIRAAGELFLVDGFSGTTIREIAERAGVSTGSVMAVGDKGTLLVDVFDAFIAAAHDAAKAPTGNRVAERALDIVRPFVQIFTTHPELSRAYASTLVGGVRTAEVFDGLAARLIDEFVAAGSTSDQARAMHAAYLGTLFLSTSREPDRDVLESDLARLFTAIAGA